jgi:sigma-B regulation protein RsbU (phosphoserine phosphatase)
MAEDTTSPAPVRVLLIDDQAIVGESVRRMLADERDIELQFCQQPARAIEAANAFRPTVILQDLVMPDIDGLQLVKFFRANKPTRDVPMIVLSSKEEPVIKAKAFALGANDYLVKLPDKLEVVARIRYHSRGYINLLERNEAYERLAESQRELAAEVAQAARYVQSLLPATLTDRVRIEWRFVPSTQLGGDMFGYHWIDPDHLALYLLDVSGHGVGSSLLAVSAHNLLAAQSLQGADCRDPGQVLTRLNDVFPMEKQDNKYFTIWYGVYRPADRTLAYSNAGHPSALLYHGPAPEAESMEELASVGPAVGVAPEFPFDTMKVQLAPHARLLLFSDGVFEIEKPSGAMWTFKEFVPFVSSLAGGDGSVIDRLLAHVRGMHDTELLGDDFSMLEVRFN